MTEEFAQDVDAYTLTTKFLSEYNDLHDSHIKKLVWQAHEGTVKIYFHDIFNQYFDAEKYNGKKRTGRIKFSSCSSTVMDIGVDERHNLTISHVEVVKVKTECKLRLGFAGGGYLELQYEKVEFPSI